MASLSSSIALRTATAPALFSKLCNRIRSASAVTPSVCRCLNTDNTQVSNISSDDLGSVEPDRRRSSNRSVARRRDTAPSFFPEVVDPFSPTRTLSQVLNLMDHFLHPVFRGATRGVAGPATAPTWGWRAKEDENTLYLFLDMPGLGREDVNVCVEQNTLVIKGEGKKESEEEESGRRYSSRIDLPPNPYKIDEIKAEMKNGVLKVVVPKVQEEERKNVREVQVE